MHMQLNKYKFFTGLCVCGRGVLWCFKIFVFFIHWCTHKHGAVRMPPSCLHLEHLLSDADVNLVLIRSSGMANKQSSPRLVYAVPSYLGHH